MKLEEYLRVNDGGWTQEQFGQCLGLSQQSVCALVNETQDASLRVAISIQHNTDGCVTARELRLSTESKLALDEIEALVKLGATFE